MLTLLIRKKFDKDLKRSEKRGKNLSKLKSIVDDLQSEKPLATKHRPHILSGDWADCWECHIEPDWLLIYQITDEELILIRTGSHSDLFD